MLYAATEVERLRAIAQRVENGQPLDDELSEWLVNSLRRFLDNHEGLDKAFGLQAARGGMPWWREEANRTRDKCLRQCAELVGTGDCPTRQARTIETLARRYAASAWLHDRASEDMPHRYGGTVQEFLWRAFKSGARMPIGQRQLRAILAQS